MLRVTPTIQTVSHEASLDGDNDSRSEGGSSGGEDSDDLKQLALGFEISSNYGKPSSLKLFPSQWFDHTDKPHVFLRVQPQLHSCKEIKLVLDSLIILDVDSARAHTHTPRR